MKRTVEQSILGEARRRARQRKRRTRPHEKENAKIAFLYHLQTGLSISASAEKAKVDRKTVYLWKEADPAFAKAWENAWEQGADLMEDEMLRRGRAGWDEPLAYQGRLTGDVVRKFSDVLLIVSHKLRRPHLHREYQKVTLSGPNDGPIQVEDPRKVLFDIIERKRARRAPAPTPAGSDPACN